MKGNKIQSIIFFGKLMHNEEAFVFNFDKK